MIVAVALVGFVFGSASAQQEPWRLVRGSDGTLFVFRGDVRNRIVPSPMGDAHLVAEGEAWEDGFLRGTELPPSPAPSAPSPQAIAAPGVEGWTMLADVAGQTATGTFSSQRVRATVIEMMTGRPLPSSRERPGGTFDARSAVGTFIVVLANVENIGSASVCCLPEFRLRDSRGRLFTGDVSESDAKVKHAIQIFYGLPYQRDDYQPGLPIKRAFIYDVPVDASGFSLAGDGR